MQLYRLGDRIRLLCLMLGRSSFFFSTCSLPSFEEVKGVVTIFFPYLERKEVSSCRLRGKRRSPIVSREVGGACLSFFEMELLSVSLD